MKKQGLRIRAAWACQCGFHWGTLFAPAATRFNAPAVRGRSTEPLTHGNMAQASARATTRDGILTTRLEKVILAPSRGPNTAALAGRK